MFNNLAQLGDLMKNAGKLRESVAKASETLGQIEVEGMAGQGAVTVRANGRLEILAVRIDPKILAADDMALLEELVKTATNQALILAREAAAARIEALTGGFPLPAGLANLFGGGA